ncbi:MAG TPA: SDR family oxidoreductase [Acidimicrobiales bacterium]
MNLGIEGRKAAVAAASAGLGHATARALREAGCEVAICARDRDRLERAAAEIGATPILADVSQPEGAAGFVRQATAALGGVDILVTNAGGPPRGSFATTPFDEYQRALELNLLSVIAMCTEAVPSMRAKGWGRIVGITSVTVRQPSTMLILSNTARAGATAFLKTLALEVAADGVTVNTVQPGFHATERMRELGVDRDELAKTVPVRAVGDPRDFGQVVAFLCSQHARYITGAAIPVDGGQFAGLQ